MTAKVPNYNALSSLLDRLAIENIKLGYFENALKHDNLDETTTVEYARKAETQRDMISVLKHDTIDLMFDAFEHGRYEVLAEGRTFK